MYEDFTLITFLNEHLESTFRSAHTEGRLIFTLFNTATNREYKFTFDYGRLRFISFTTPEMRERRTSGLLLERDFWGNWHLEKGIESVPLKRDFSFLSPPEISIQSLTDFAYTLINTAHQNLVKQKKNLGNIFQPLVSHTLRFNFQALEAERTAGQALDLTVPLILPPFADLRLCFPVMQGCKKQSLYGPCSFCDTFINRPFRILSLAEILDYAQRKIDWLDGRISSGYEIFLTEADALVAPISSIELLIRYLKNQFPAVSRFSSFASVLSLQGNGKMVREKNVDELKRLAQAGLTRIYLGIESGSDLVLEDMNKKTTQQSMLKAAKKIRKAGLELACLIISGYGGRELSKEHLQGTITFLHQSKPDRVFFSRIEPKPGTTYWSRKYTSQRTSEIDAWEKEIQSKVPSTIIFRQYTQLNLAGFPKNSC